MKNVCQLMVGVAMLLGEVVGAEEWSSVVEPGFGGSNAAVTAMAVHGGSLWIGTRNPSGAEVWRTVDGVTWTCVLREALGGIEKSVESMASYNGDLYFGTQHFVWRIREDGFPETVSYYGFGNGNNRNIRALGTFEGRLYAGTSNQWTGFEIWRAADEMSWEPMLTGPIYNHDVLSFAEFRSRLYASTEGEVYWSMNGTSWAQVPWVREEEWLYSGTSLLVPFDGALYLVRSSELYPLPRYSYYTETGLLLVPLDNGGFDDQVSLVPLAGVAAGDRLVFGGKHQLGGAVFDVTGALLTEMDSAVTTESTSVRSIAVFGEHLYVGTEPDCRIWRTPLPLFADGFDSGDTAYWSGVGE